MDTRVAVLAQIMVVLTSALLALGSDCAVSREFENRHSQILKGALQDPEGRALSGSGIELLSGKQMVQSVRTDNLGMYDFGEVPSGKYRVHVHAYAFCAPQVICKADSCSFRPKLKLNSKNMVTVY